VESETKKRQYMTLCATKSTYRKLKHLKAETGLPLITLLTRIVSQYEHSPKVSAQ
jgi:hypothetical protein